MRDKDLKVAVHYAAAKEPYKEEAEPSETVGQLKEHALKAFGLVETPPKAYKLFYEGRELNNMNETLGQLAGEKTHLSFDLEEVLIQGNSNA
jgi:hypothetical protein